MKKRIYCYFLCLLLPCMLLLAAALSIMFQSAGRRQELSGIKGHARLVSDLLSNGIIGELQFSDYISYASDAPRITVISQDGSVLLDSRSIAESLDNHMDRPEIIEAFQNGFGEATRYSETFKASMYYYAMKLPNGNVLRVSAIVGGVSDALAIALPTVIVITALFLLITNFAARRLTNRIIAPLQNIDFDGEFQVVYDELTPYAKKIDRQKKEIDEKIVALSERANTIETITRHMNEGLILTDALGRVLTANDSAREIVGDDVDNANILHVYRERDFQNALRRCLKADYPQSFLDHEENAKGIDESSSADLEDADRKATKELRLSKGDRTYSVYFSPVISEKAVRGAVILFHEITDTLKAEKQRREFSANVSHELKTPLTTISALSEMIGSGIAKDEDIKSFALRIKEQASRLLVLIEDIIRLSEFDEGNGRKEDTVFSLWDLAKSVIASFHGNSLDIGVQLVGERFDITANLRMIDELLFNLIDNGLKYNVEGGFVKVELKKLDNGLCSISVSDSGIGISKDHQARVFERFYRVDGSRSKKTGGTGLGLSIVKHIVDLHNGSIELSSVENEGTTVTCYL